MGLQRHRCNFHGTHAFRIYIFPPSSPLVRSNAFHLRIATACGSLKCFPARWCLERSNRDIHGGTGDVLPTDVRHAALSWIKDRFENQRVESRRSARSRAAQERQARPAAKIAYRMLVNSWQPGIPRDGRAKRERKVIKYVSWYIRTLLSPCGFHIRRVRVWARVSLPLLSPHRFFCVYFWDISPDTGGRSPGSGSTWASMLDELKFKRLPAPRPMDPGKSGLKVSAWLCHRLTLNE